MYNIVYMCIHTLDYIALHYITLHTYNYPLSLLCIMYSVFYHTFIFAVLAYFMVILPRG